MFDYIKIDEGANRLLMCILILAICWFLVKWKKRATLPFNVVMVYISVGFVSATVFYCLSQNYWYYFDSKDINLAPLLYLVFLFIVLALPFCMIDLKNIKRIDDTGISPYLNGMATAIFILSILPFIDAVIKLPSLDYSTIVTAYEGEGERSSFLFYYSNQLRNYLKFFISPLLFYYLYKESAYKRYANYMFFAVFTNILLAITSGGRGTMVNDLNYLIICYILFRGLLPPKVKYKIKRIGIIGGMCTVAGLTVITFARNNFDASTASDEDKANIVTGVSLYLGQGPLEFSRNMYPSTVRTEGDNSFSLVKTALGMKTFKDNDDRREYWEDKQTIPNFIFYTVIGDVYSDLDFGYTILFCVLISLVFCVFFYKTRFKPMSIQMVVIISLYFEWVTMGFMNNCYKNYYSQFYILITLLINILLSFIQNNRKTLVHIKKE
ncbi:O-antigen polymerase [Paraprevotella clara]|uniref:O-antigen polymerase n=1 Tax=Paraprevotella clara TaxID=454154 RepID=UPI00402A3975